MQKIGTILSAIILLTACGGGGGGSSDSGGGGSSDGGGADGIQPPAITEATVLAANDLGMHCMDREFSVFSILPPFNVINTQVVKRDSNGHPFVADDVDVEVFFEAVADTTGSINSFSKGKTDF